MIKSLLIFGALQGFVFSIALLSIANPKNVLTNRLFSLLIFVVSLFLLVSSQTIYFAQFPKFFLASYVLIYLYCPIYSLFTESLTNTDFKLNRSHLLHILPATLYLLVLSRYLFLSKGEVIEILMNKAAYDLTSMDLIAILLNIYFVWSSWRRVKRSNNLSIPYAKEWAFTLLGAILLISNLAWLLVIIPQLGLAMYTVPYRLDVVYISMSCMILVFGYVLVIRAEYFSVRTIVQNIRYRNVNIDQAIVHSMEQKIVDALESTKPYKNPKFDLQDLATLVGVDKFKLSYTINKSMKTNFTSLINKYKVEEFIQMVNSNDYANFSMLGIATEAGFSSKSTFYKAFKEIKGQTPKEFFKDNQHFSLKSA